MAEPTPPTPEERLLNNLNDKQLELVLFYLMSNAERGLSAEDLTHELGQKIKGAEYKPSGFHITHQIMALADCMKKHGRVELAERLIKLVGQLPKLLQTI